MSRLFVSNLPKDTTEEALRKIFSLKGVVTDCSLKFTKDGKCRRFAFIGYKTEEEARAAQQYFNFTFVKSSKIKVEHAVDVGNNRRRPWSRYSQLGVERAAQSHVGNDKLAERKNTHKDVKDDDLLGTLKGDTEFQDFMGAYDTRNRQVWKNDMGTDNLQVQPITDNDSQDDDSENSDEEVIADTKPGTSKSEQISDLEFLKSRMTGLASDEEDSSEPDNAAGMDTERGESERKTPVMTQDSSVKHHNFVLKMKGLPATVKESAVREFFRPIKVKVTMPKNKNKLSVGIAFVQCRSEKDLESALVKNKTFIGKKKVFLSKVSEKQHEDINLEEMPKPWEQKEKALEEEESIAESGRLFVRNLPYECTEDDLEQLFSKYGPVAELDIPVDNVTKKNKGFAHVTYLIPEHAIKAFSDLDHKGFMGRLMHILPGKDKTETYVSSEKSSYKKEKDAKTKALSKSDHNWNTLFLSADAVAEAMAVKYSTDKSAILDDSGKTSLGVRMALGETQLVHETRKFLLDHGVALGSFSQADGKRSKTVILVKDLKADLTTQELEDIFGKYGTIHRIVLPPHGSTAIIQFQEPSEARRAFTKTAYRTFKGQPMYLEWAPMSVFSEGSKPGDKGVDVSDSGQASQVTTSMVEGSSTSHQHAPIDTLQQAGEGGSESDGDTEPGATLFIKNLSFDTQDMALNELFSRSGPVRRVTIARKKDLKNPGKLLSMGYGFVEYKTAQHAMEALKTLQHHTLDGHQLELKVSHRETLQPKSSRKRQEERAQGGSTKIIVRNIPFQANKKEIAQLFRVFGELKFVRLPKKAGGPGIRGFAFVDFVTKQDAKRAFDSLCHSTHLYGRRLVLEWASAVDTVEELQRKTAQHFYTGPPAKKLRKKSILEALE